MSETTRYAIEGMTCTNCAKNVERAVERAGFEGAAVSFQRNELRLCDEDVDLDRLRRTIKEAGYDLLDPGTSSSPSAFFQPALVVALLAAIYFMVTMFVPWHSIVRTALDVVLATGILGLGLARYGRRAVQSVRNGSPNMYVLILLGASVAWVFSLVLLLTADDPFHIHVYFETTAVLIALVMLGERIEERAIERTTKSLTGLARENIAPARRIAPDGTIDEVMAEELDRGDQVLVNAGDQVPADGRVLEGAGHADESLLTGESDAVHKATDSEVLGGSVLSGGSIRMEVTTTADRSVLARIEDLTRRAADEKASVQQYADRISAIFVPSVVVVALGVFAINLWVVGTPIDTAILRAVATLVVSCPCAMGLATPLAITVGVEQLTRHGILSKSARAIETFGRIDRLILDKTGTLTEGRVGVERLEVVDADDATVRGLLRALESRSSHPIARSILDAVGDAAPAELDDIEEVSGKGMTARWSGQSLKLGQPGWGGAPDADADVVLTADGRVLARIDLADRLKSGSEQTVRAFVRRGTHVSLLSGDASSKVKVLAERLGIEHRGGVTPAEKYEAIQSSAESGTTAMVGDGINDSPALQMAHVGLTFSEASDISMTAADIILLGDDIGKLDTAWQISKATERTIRQNLFWALIYNVVAIPLAAIGLFQPIAAAGLMVLSDLVLVGNSYRLKRRRFG